MIGAADSWKDEFKMAMLGITGGSLYFLSENEAMNYTTTTNTSLIVCSCPLFATLLVRLAYRHSSRINMIQLLGSLLAFDITLTVLFSAFPFYFSSPFSFRLLYFFIAALVGWIAV